MDNHQSLRVGIVGGGVGGLALALSLSRMDLERRIAVDIYESAPELTQIGAGISIWPRTWEVLKKLGIDQELAKYLPRYPDTEPRSSFQFRKGDQQEGITIKDMMMKGGAVSFHRAEVQKAFLTEVSQSYRCHLSHRLVSYEESDNEVLLTFQNGSVTACDVLVGADGIKSVVRKGFIMDKCPGEIQYIEPVWSGTVVYRGLYDAGILRQKMPEHRSLARAMIYWGKNRHVVSYPIMQGSLINIAAYFSEPEKEGSEYLGSMVAEAPRDELLDLYATWEDEVRVLLEAIDKPSRWAIQTVGPLKLYASGRVALVGDSAHAMTPNLGAGAGQAIEDAYILGTVLSKAADGHISVQKALEIYTHVCQPVGNFVMDSARTLGLLYEFNAPGFEAVRGNELVPFERLEEMFREVEQRWRWVDDTSAEDERDRAIQLLKVSVESCQ